MGLLEIKRTDAMRALDTLREILRAEFSKVARDAAIQRFEYTAEALWKYLQAYLREKEGIDCYSPKACFREARNAGLMDEDETLRALEMVDDRNMTSHTYHEEVAEAIYKKLPAYTSLMDILMKRTS